MYRQPQVDAPLIVIATNGTVRAHEKATGRRAWELVITGLAQRSVVRLAVEGSCVVGFGLRTVPKYGMFESNEYFGVLFAIDYATGRLRWNVRIDDRHFLSPTLLVEAPYVFLANEAVLYAYDLEDGRPLWQDIDEGTVALESYPGPSAIALATPGRNAQGDVR